MATFTLGPLEPYEGDAAPAGGGFTLGQLEPYQPDSPPPAPRQPAYQSMRVTGQSNVPPADITTPIRETANRAAAYLYQPGSAARSAAMEQRGLPPQAGFGQEMIAEMAGEAPTMTGAGIGAALGAMSPIPGGALIGAGIGGGMGALYRRMASLQATDELTPETAWGQALPGAARDATWEMAFAGAGPAIGRGVQRVAQSLRQPGEAVGGYIRGLRGTVPMDRAATDLAAENYNLAAQMERRTGIPFGRTPGELLDNPALREREMLMFQYPDTAPDMQNMLRERAIAAENLGEQMAQSFTPGRTITADEGFAALPEAAKNLVDGMRARRSELMRPLYRSVLENMPDVNINGLRRELQSRSRKLSGDARAALDKELATINELAGGGNTVPASALHEIQQRRAADARKLGTSTSAGEALLNQVAKPVQRTLRKASKDYDQLTRDYARISDELETFRDQTRLGQLSGVNPARYADAGRRILSGTASAGDVRKLRKNLRAAIKDVYGEAGGRAARENEVMQGVKTAWFEDALGKIQPKESGEVPNVGGKLYRIFGGDPNEPGGRARTEMLEALLSPRELPRLNELTKALRQTSALFSRGSQTAGRLGAGSGNGMLADLFIEGGLGGQAAMTRILARAAPGFVEKYLAGGQSTNRAHAAAIVGGLESSMQHLRELNRELQRLRLRPPIDIDNATARAWGRVLGNLGEAGYEAAVPEPTMAAGFAGG